MAWLAVRVPLLLVGRHELGLWSKSILLLDVVLYHLLAVLHDELVLFHDELLQLVFLRVEILFQLVDQLCHLLFLQPLEVVSRWLITYLFRFFTSRLLLLLGLVHILSKHFRHLELNQLCLIFLLLFKPLIEIICNLLHFPLLIQLHFLYGIRQFIILFIILLLLGVLVVQE